MLVLGAVLFVGLMVMAVLAVDFSRVVSQRNEIHTAADAGALAGAVQLLQTPTSTEAADTAVVYAQQNIVPSAPTPTAELGFWNDAASSFNSGSSEPNAIRVRTQRGTNYLIGSLVNLLPATMRRTSVAWATAPVVETPCVRPWALPYDTLLIRLGISDPDHVLDAGDLVELMRLPIASRRVTLKLGANNPGPVNGNFNAVVVPSYWQASKNAYRSPRPQPGANEYRDRISATSCPDLVGVGDSLDTEPGNMAGPTLEGTDALCAQFGGVFGNGCGTSGAPIKIALYGADRVNGRDPVKVRAIAGFVLESIEHGSGHGLSKGEVTGYFTVLPSTGPVASSGNSTIVRPILVQ
jgi:Flp pilus assembly protein TadG